MGVSGVTHATPGNQDIPIEVCAVLEAIAVKALG